MFIPNLYMFRAPLCSSSGELIVSTRHLVYVTVCRWHLVYVTVCRWHLVCRFGWNPNLHTRRSPTCSDIYQMSPTYSDIYQMSYWHN